MEFPIEVWLESRQDYVEVMVEVDGIWENDGIGAYEYWGHRGFDKGHDYFVIESAEWDKTGFTPEEIKEIEAAIDAKTEDWATEIMENPSEPDYD